VRNPRRPSKVKIGAHTYSITYVDPKKVQGCVGECFASTKRIRIRKDLKGRYLAEVVLHEIKHGIWYEFGIMNSENAGTDGVSRATEETAINGLTNGLMAVLRDNPEFHTFLFHYSK